MALIAIHTSAADSEHCLPQTSCSCSMLANVDLAAMLLVYADYLECPLPDAMLPAQ